MCEGAIIVDRDARIVWISDKYAARLELASPADAVGKVVEDVIPNSLMREVVRTGEPIMLDIMQFGPDSFVVMRVPIKDERGRVIGARGLHALRPPAAPAAAGVEVPAPRDRARRHAEDRSPRSGA